MSDPQAMHWRRHDGEASATDGELEGWIVTASACGRLVDYVFATPDASEADCSECEELAQFFNQIPFPSRRSGKTVERPPNHTLASTGDYEATLKAKEASVRRQLLEGDWDIDTSGDDEP